ncbi:MAG: phosphatase PAP2-related protein [Candidatus Gracilibacteria bacterium]|jgi:hypothetical protein
MIIVEFFARALHQWKILLKDKAFTISFLIGWIVLGGGYVMSQIASAYHDLHFYPSVGDYVLEIIPVYNLSFLYIWGFTILIVSFFVYGILFEPEKAPFILKTFGILLLVRAGFISLTFMGPPAEFFYIKELNAEYIRKAGAKFFFNNDLFFSGHTAAPFLGYLLAKGSRWRWFFLLGSLVMAATVLIMHIHYSIDVFAAFFITYGVYAMSNRVFNGLNVRFKTRIELYGWDTIKQKIWKQ